MTYTRLRRIFRDLLENPVKSSASVERLLFFFDIFALQLSAPAGIQTLCNKFKNGEGMGGAYIEL